MAGSGLAVTNLMQLRYGIEVTPGVVPTIAFTNVRAKTQTLEMGMTYVSSQELRADRQVPDQVRTDETPAGDIGFEVSWQSHDDFLLAALQASAWGTAAQFTGATSDITATSTGLASTVLDFTTESLSVGQWIKIGGITTIEQFATAADNDYARITAIAAHALTLDNLPAAWATDSGTGKTIAVVPGSYARNGTTMTSFDLERQHTDITQFFHFHGMYVDKLTLKGQTGQILEGTVTFKGLTATRNTVTDGTGSPIAANTNPVLNATSNVPRFQVGGTVPLGKAKTLQIDIANNLRDQKAISVLGNLGVGDGTFDAQITMEAYFKDSTIYDAYLNGTATSFGFVFQDSAGNAYVFTVPSARITDCKVNAGAINTDVILQLTAKSKIDTLTGCMLQIDRIPVAT